MRRSASPDRALLALVLLILVSGAGAGASFGTFSYDRYQQTDDLSGEFRVGMLNLGNTSLTVHLSAETGNDTTVSFDQDSFELAPSEQGQATGSGWVHLDGGRYARPTVISPTVTIDEDATTRNHTVTISVTAVQEDEDGAEQVQQRIVQESSHRFTLHTSSGLIGTGSDDGGDVFDVEDPSTPSSNDSQDDPGGVLSILPGQEAPNDLTRPDQSEARDAADGWTTTSYVLLAGILLMGGYIVVNLL